VNAVRKALNNVGRHTCGTGVRDDERLFAWMEAVTSEIERLHRQLGSHAHPISGMPSYGTPQPNPRRRQANEPRAF
jgi:hypothetical protein